MIDEDAFQAMIDGSEYAIASTVWSSGSLRNLIEAYEAAKVPDQPLREEKPSGLAGGCNSHLSSQQPVECPFCGEDMAVKNGRLLCRANWDGGKCKMNVALPERELGEETVPKWALDSQIQISNVLRAQLEACQKQLMGASSFLGIEGLRTLTPEEVKSLVAPFGCDECGCSINFHAPSCSKSTKIEDQTTEEK